MTTRNIISLELPKALKEDLLKIAESKDMSVSAIIRVAIKEYLQREHIDETKFN